MARFVELYSDVETTSQVTGEQAFIKRAVQRALDRVSGFHHWPFYLEDSFFSTVDDVTAGTVAVTNGSATVTGTSTAFTSAMIGRKFRVGSQNAYYTIAAVASGTSLMLDQNFQGADDTSCTYVIYQDEYRLVADVDAQYFLREIENGFALIDLDPGTFDLRFPTPVSFGNPDFSVPIGRRQDIYETGTVAVTAGSRTITGSGTPAWDGVQGLSRGNRIRITDTGEVLTINTVDSATQLTAYENAVTTDASSAYQIFLDNLVVQLYNIPDAARNIYYRNYRKPTPLVNDYDEPDLPSNMQWLLIQGALEEAWAHKGDDARRRSAVASFQGGLQQFKKHFTSIPRLYGKKPQTALSRRLQPRFSATTDVRATAP